jgi:hypothetical protein
MIASDKMYTFPNPFDCTWSLERSHLLHSASVILTVSRGCGIFGSLVAGHSNVFKEVGTE